MWRSSSFTINWHTHGPWQYLATHYVHYVFLLAEDPPAKEADECLQDAEGRWLSFSLKNEDMVLLERKGLPGHLSKLENLDTAVTLQSLLVDLQDAGEVPLFNWWLFFWGEHNRVV